jgi:hypothetical protein
MAAFWVEMGMAYLEIKKPFPLNPYGQIQGLFCVV